MRNRNTIIFLLLIFTGICGYNLFHTSRTFSIESELRDADTARYREMISDEELMDKYRKSQESSLALGLDLQGGMFVTLEIGVEDIVREMAGNTDDETFNKAIQNAKEAKITQQESFVTLFYQEWQKLNPNGKLSGLFANPENEINFSTSDAEILDFLEDKAEIAIEQTFNVIRTRIDNFGVASPNLQLQEGTGRILLELPGVRDPDRVRKLLRGTAKLNFYETYGWGEGWNELMKANEIVKKIKGFTDEADTTGADTTDAIAGDDGDGGADDDEIDPADDDAFDPGAGDDADTASDDTGDVSSDFFETDDSLAEGDSLTDEEQLEKFLRDYPILEEFSVNQAEIVNQNPNTPVMGYMRIADTTLLNKWLRHPDVIAVMPNEVKFVWGKVDGSPDFLALIACKLNMEGKAALDGEAISNAKQDYSSDGKNEPIVTLAMNSEGAKAWSDITGRNVNKSVAIVMDDFAYSWPNVRQQITGGRSEISGGFDLEEAKDLANLLNSGTLPVQAIIQGEEIVGPTLGKKNIEAGLLSFLIAFVVTIVFMLFYYSTSGLVANIALILNLFFILGVSSSFNVVLTLPGIAAIVLTMGMAVDANVLIFERIREEQNLGKSLKASIQAGFKNAFSSVMDANITTFLTGVVLFAFGLGPIRGFAVNLMIGIVTSLIAALFVTRLILDFLADRGTESVKFGTDMTMKMFKEIDIKMTARKKLGYAVSGILIVLSIASFVVNGFKTGVDFDGGRQYRVAFQGEIDIEQARKDLTVAFDNTSPVIKTIGGEADKLLITTNYLVDKQDMSAEVKAKLLNGIKAGHPNANPEIIQETLVGPTVAADIQRSAMYSVIFALFIIFAYTRIRFRRWQYSAGALAALVHDVVITLGIFSLFGALDILPFSLDVDQAFIAAILTIVGYSINDTVVVFDRIRENVGEMKTAKLSDIFNTSLNQTISRTLITSVTTMLTILVLFFMGGDTIKGFMFALLVGIVFGTYSSIFVASPIAHDLLVAKDGQGGQAELTPEEQQAEQERQRQRHQVQRPSSKKKKS